MSFMDGKPLVATEKHCKSWGGSRENGSKFRCYLCGHKFVVGDVWRFQYVNDIKGAYGNPLVCENCDEGHEKTRKKWVKLCKQYESDKFWWFRHTHSYVL